MKQKTVHSFKITVNAINRQTSEIIDFSDTLISFSGKENYLGNVFALYVLKFQISNEQLQFLSENDVNFSISILRATNVLNQSNEDYDLNDITYDKEIFNDVLRPFNRPKIENIKDKEYESDDDATPDQQKIIYTINCISIAALSYNNPIINGIYTDTTLKNVLVNIVSSVFKETLYFQDPDNTAIFPTIFIPPMNLVPALEFLESGYEIYKSDFNMFIKSDHFYVYCINQPERNYEHRFDINIVNMTQNTNDELYQYFQLDENDNGDIYYKNTPVVSDTHDIVANVVGNNMIAYSYDNNFNLVTRNYNTESDYNKVRYYWNNKKTKVAELGTLEQFTNTCTISLANIDDSLFEPSTRIQINGSTLDFANGIYSLVLKIFTYKSDNFRTYTNNVVLQLAK